MKSAFQKLMERGKSPRSPLAERTTNVDEIIARAERAAGPQSVVRAIDLSPMVARGKSLQALGERITVELEPGLGKIGALFIPDTTKSSGNQTFTRAKVISAGAKVKQALAGTKVIVSDYFGDSVRLEDGSKLGRALRLGRERDIVGLDTPKGIVPVGDRVLLEEIAAPTMAGRLYLPEDVLAKQFEARVMAVGPDAAVKIGDRVLIAKDTSVVVRIYNLELRLIESESILAVL